MFVIWKGFWWWCVSLKITCFSDFFYNLLFWTECTVSEMVFFHPWMESWRGTQQVWCSWSFQLRMEMSSFRNVCVLPNNAKSNVLFLSSPFKALKWAERGKTESLFSILMSAFRFWLVWSYGTMKWSDITRVTSD